MNIFQRIQPQKQSPRIDTVSRASLPVDSSAVEPARGARKKFLLTRALVIGWLAILFSGTVGAYVYYAFHVPPTVFSFGHGLEVTAALPTGFQTVIDTQERFPTIRIMDMKSNTSAMTLALNPYLVPNYIDNQDGKITIDGIPFVIAGSKTIGCPLYAIFPEHTLKQPYTLGFTISTYCFDSDTAKDASVLDGIVHSLRFNATFKEALNTDNYADGFLNLSFESLNRTPDELKKLLLAYASSTDVLRIDRDVARIKNEYNQDALFSLSYEVMNNNLYPIVEGTGVNPFEKGSSLSVLNDPVLHRYVYEYVWSLYPESIRNLLGYVYFGTDGLSDNLAWVARKSASSPALILYVDIADVLNSARHNDLEFVKTLIHESAHVLTYRNDQLAVDYSQSGNGKASCTTYYISGWGCALAHSYMADYYEKFWKGKYTDRPAQLTGWDERTKYLNKYPRDFVTAYSTTNPMEDFAESFLFYVFSDNPANEIAKKTVIGKKVGYFESTTGLVYLRNAYRKILGLSYDHSIDQAGQGAGNFPQGTLLETFKKLVPDFATYNGSENKNDCGDNVTEGQCLHVDYHWGTDASVAEVLSWYKNTLPRGWSMQGDMANGYATLVSADKKQNHLFFVKDGALYPEVKAKTVITISEYFPGR